MKEVNATNYAITVEVDGEKSLKNFAENKWNRYVEAVVKGGNPAPIPERVQTFVTHEVESVADILELVPNEEVAVALFNRGASLKQLTAIREYMEDAGFETADAPYDLREDLNAVTERRSASPEDKVSKLLSQLDDAAMARIMEMLSARATART